MLLFSNNSIILPDVFRELRHLRGFVLTSEVLERYLQMAPFGGIIKLSRHIPNQYININFYNRIYKFMYLWLNNNNTFYWTNCITRNKVYIEFEASTSDITSLLSSVLEVLELATIFLVLLFNKRIKLIEKPFTYLDPLRKPNPSPCLFNHKLLNT